MRCLAILSVLTLSVSSIIIASPLEARDTENNVLIGYYDGISFKHKKVEMENLIFKYSGYASFIRRVEGLEKLQPTKIYYAELIYARPGVICELEGLSRRTNYDPNLGCLEYDGQMERLARITSQDPFVPYEGSLDHVFIVFCREDISV